MTNEYKDGGHGDYISTGNNRRCPRCARNVKEFWQMEPN